MLKEFSWRTFEDTGNIEAYIVYKQVVEKDNNIIDRIFAQEEVAISK